METEIWKDNRVFALVDDWRRLKGQKPTPEDRRRYGSLDIDKIQTDLHRYLPSDNPWPERINAEEATVVYNGDHGRRTITLHNLGYTEIDGRFVKAANG